MFENIFGRLGKRRRTEDGDDTLSTASSSASHARSRASASAGAGGSNFGIGGDNSSSSSSSAAAFWDNLFRNSVEATSNFCANVTSGFQPTTTATATDSQPHLHPQQQQQQSTAAQQYNLYYEQEQQRAAYEAASLALRPYDNDRFVSALDRLDAHVEQFRKDAVSLQEKRDFLLMSIDLIKSDDRMQSMRESERDEIMCYIQRISSRLSTVDLNVRTVRDRSQEDSLSQINALIDMMITIGDPVMSRQRCQQYLNACCSTSDPGAYQYTIDTFNFGMNINAAGGGSAIGGASTAAGAGPGPSGFEMDPGPVDKKFESVLLGCTLDDQKNIKKRLQALMDYLNKQIIRN